MKNIILVLFAALFLSGCGDNPNFGEEMFVIKIEIEGQGKVKGSGSFSYGDECRLLAVPDTVNGYKFDSWRQLPEDVIVCQDENYIFEVDESRILQIVFVK